jgi:hypothetical protein
VKRTGAAKEDVEEHLRGKRDRKALDLVRGFQMDHSQMR